MPLLAHSEVILVLAITLVAIALSGVNAMQHAHGRTITGYFLAEKKAGWLREAGSLFVTTIWSLMCVWIVIPAAWKLEGWAVAGMIAVAALLVLGRVFVPLYRKVGAVTVPQFVGHRFGDRVGAAMSLSAILLVLCVRIPLAIALGGAALQYLFGWDLTLTSVLAVVVPGLLAVAGGFAAVLAMQGMGAIVALGGLAAMAARGSGLNILSSGLTHDADPINIPVTAGAAVVMGAWYMCADQFTVQRPLAARSSADARKASVIAAALIGAGMALVALGSGTPLMRSSSGVVPQDFVTALLGAAILSMMMAYVAGQFLSVAAMVSMDIYPALRPGRNEASTVLVGRLTASLAALLAVVAALATTILPSPPLGWLVYPYAVLVPPAVVIAVIGLPWKRMQVRGASWGLGAGWATGAAYGALRLSQDAGLGVLPETALLSFCASAFVLIGVSFAVAPARAVTPLSHPAFGEGKK